MTTITFDTLNYTEQLKKTGVPEKQAMAQTKALKQAFDEVINSQIATKQDLAKIEYNLESKIKILQWMLGLVIAIQIVPLLKTLF